MRLTKDNLSLTTRIPLNNKTSIPQLGFGAWKLGSHEETKKVVLMALEAGYRHIDSAAAYLNEAGVGEAIRESGIPRSEIYLTTKLANIHQRDKRQQHGFEKSLNELKLDYVDLYLLHWPVPDRYRESWKLLEQLNKQGLARAIGVSNFRVSHLKDLMTAAEIIPAVNQIEFNPGIQDYETINFCFENGIAVEAWSPLGGGKNTSDPAITAIGAKYGKTASQVILRWILQKGIIVFPKSVHIERIRENSDIFDFELSKEDCSKIDAMNSFTRTGRNPDEPDTFIYREVD